jgi:hypothetical protein
MDLVSRSVTRRGSLANQRRSTAAVDQAGHIGSLHIEILEWIEARRGADTRPQLAGIPPLAVDRAVAELVLAGLITAIAVPGSKYDQGHWQPTGLTAAGWEALVRYRRRQPRPAGHRWWRLKLFG